MTQALSQTESRLLDEIEQLRTALEDSQNEQKRLAQDRQALSERLQQQARAYQELRVKHDHLVSIASGPGPGQAVAIAVHGQTEEELRVAFEELQVLTEELEAANHSLREANRDLDRRVEARTSDLARANEELRTSEASFQAVANLIPDLVLRFGYGGEAQWSNARWFAYTGQTDADVLGWGWLSPVHPVERSQLRGDWQLAAAKGVGFARECRLKGTDGGYRWFLFRLEPTPDAAGEVRSWYGAITDTHDQWSAFQALRASEARFRTLIEGIPQLVWRSRKDGYWSWSSPQWTSFTGLSAEASQGYGWLRAVHPDDRDKARAAWAATEGQNPLAMELRIRDAAKDCFRHFRVRATPVQGADGRALEWLGSSTDVDDILQLQSRQQVLVAELQHRTRNLMAVVTLLVRRTLDSSTSLADFRERVMERLGALSRVQTLLSRRAQGTRVTFDELLRAELAAHVTIDPADPGNQVRLSGPSNIGLRSANVQTLALALHELTTNAVKYGAFSTPTGRLDVSWALEKAEAERRLVVDWRETGVAELPKPGAAPRGGGYGRELIEKALPYQLGARTEFRFAEGGVHCVIDVPMD